MVERTSPLRTTNWHYAQVLVEQHLIRILVELLGMLAYSNFKRKVDDSHQVLTPKGDAMAPAFLERQAGPYAQEWPSSESWKPLHREAMRCAALEDAIRLGLTILANFDRRTDCWNADVEHDGSRFSWDRVQEFAAAYRWWLERTAVLLKAVTECQDSGYHVDDAEKIREAYREVSLMSLDVPQIRRSLESLKDGRGRPMDQAFNELRDHRRRRRTG